MGARHALPADEELLAGRRREQVALHWLRLHEPGVVWNRFLSHLDELAYRVRTRIVA